MSFETALQLTADYYGHYPGPTQDTYELAEQVAKFFKQNAIKTAGVIAVAIGSDDYHYLGLSPDLQRAVMTEMREGQSMSHGHFRLGRGLEAFTGTKFDLCRKVADDIAQKVDSNRGCAEKKIVTNIYARDLSIEEISVIPYPDTVFGASIPAHIVVANGDGAYIAPCESCLAIYHG